LIPQTDSVQPKEDKLHSLATKNEWLDSYI